MAAAPLNRRVLVLACAALLAAHAGLLVYGAAVHSPCIDEVGHLPAGLSHWRLGRFDLYHVNPPLVRMVAAVPVLWADPKVDWSQYSDAPGARSEFAIGRQLISDNGERSFWFFTWARWACIPFSLLGGTICFRWARELYGDWSGLLALALWCFEPNILANAQMITPDTGAAALGLTAAYVFWKWLRRPTWPAALLAGGALGLALLTKTTWIILFGLWPAFWLAWRLPTRRGTGRAAGLAPAVSTGPDPKAEIAAPGRPARPAPASARMQPLQLAAVLLVGLYVLNAGYGFQGTFRRLGSYTFLSESLGGALNDRAGTAGNRFAGTWLGALPVPVPQGYLLGIDVQKRDFESHFWSYLRGQWRQEGWWYYYLYALAVKVPLGVWALGLLAAGLGLLWRGYAAAWRDELTLLAPAAAVLTLVSAETGFNHHLRYVLPIFPFLFVWMSKSARVLERGERVPAALTAGALGWVVVSSLLMYPHSMSYFNELAGGPEHGGECLVDSNIDWGQDLLFLRDWLKRHPEARPVGLAYFGNADPRAAGIEFTTPAQGPTSPKETAGPDAAELGPRAGWYAVSVALQRGYQYPIPNGNGGITSVRLNGYSYFQSFAPFDHVGWSIYIYHITPEQCAAARRRMGLPDGVEPAATAP